MINGTTVITTKNGPNIAVEWLALLLREVTGSDLGPDISYPGRFFMVFLCPSKPMPG
jgi:hypothetical protein